MAKIELSHQKNIRDLGYLVTSTGKKVKSRCLYRGGYFSKINDSDIEIINSLHLTDIVDFRGNEESKNRPDYPFKGVKYHNFPPFTDKLKKKQIRNEDGNLLGFVDDGVDGFTHMYNLYPNTLLSKNGIKAFKKFFKLISDDEKVVYFHCSQGKDRTGLAAYLLLIALGVDKKDAMNDYLKSNKAMKEKIIELTEYVKDKPFYNAQYQKSLEDIFNAKEEYINHGVEEINKKYGSVMNYIEKALKINVNRLRELYLES